MAKQTAGVSLADEDAQITRQLDRLVLTWNKLSQSILLDYVDDYIFSPGNAEEDEDRDDAVDHNDKNSSGGRNTDRNSSSNPAPTTPTTPTAHNASHSDAHSNGPPSTAQGSSKKSKTKAKAKAKAAMAAATGAAGATAAAASGQSGIGLGTGIGVSPGQGQSKGQGQGGQGRGVNQSPPGAHSKQVHDGSGSSMGTGILHDLSNTTTARAWRMMAGALVSSNEPIVRVLCEVNG